MAYMLGRKAIQDDEVELILSLSFIHCGIKIGKNDLYRLYPRLSNISSELAFKTSDWASLHLIQFTYFILHPIFIHIGYSQFSSFISCIPKYKQ